MKKSVKDLGEIKGKKALMRVDINVPLDADKNVTDDTRIQAILPTVNFLKEKGAKIILMAHLGRPKGEKNPEFTLAPVAKYLSKVLGEDVMFIPDVADAPKMVEDLKEGQVALLENIRYYKAEEAKDDDMTFANELAKLGDFYVNDAFGAAHRNHTSTAKLAKVLKPAVSGLLMEKELRCLSQALDNPTRPFTAVVGGAKVSSKIGVLENLQSYLDADPDGLSGILPSALSSYRYGREKMTIGPSDPLYALPTALNTAVLGYNATAMKKQGIIIISVDAQDIDAFNAGEPDRYGKTKEDYGIQGNVRARGFDRWDGYSVDSNYKKGTYSSDGTTFNANEEEWTLPTYGANGKVEEQIIFNNRIAMSWDEVEDEIGRAHV